MSMRQDIWDNDREQALVARVVAACSGFVDQDVVRIAEADAKIGYPEDSVTTTISAAAVNGWKIPEDLAAEVRSYIEYLDGHPIQGVLKHQLSKVV